MSEVPKHPVVLLVEDDLDVREAVADAVEDAGFGIVLASNGIEALDRLHRPDLQPDLVLLDLMMPVMNGWQFLEVFRTEGFTIPVIVLTAAVDIDLPTGVQVLRKPVEHKTLMTAIRSKLH